MRWLYQWNGSGRGGKQSGFGRFLTGGWAVFDQLGGEATVVFGAGRLLPRGTHCDKGAFLTFGGLAAHGEMVDWDFLVPALAERDPRYLCGWKLGPRPLPVSGGTPPRC